MMTYVRFSGYVPNKLNDMNHGERAAGNSAAAPLPEAAVGSLGRRQIDTAGSSRSTSSPDASGDRHCTLMTKYGAPCRFPCTMEKKFAFYAHVLNAHIGAELTRIEKGKLSTRDAQVLTTRARVERAQAHIWRCSDNCISHMRKDVIEVHIRRRHRGGGQIPVRQMTPPLVRMKRGILYDILGDEEHERVGLADIQSMLEA
jgi:hypothetical protein